MIGPLSGLRCPGDSASRQATRRSQGDGAHRPLRAQWLPRVTVTATAECGDYFGSSAAALTATNEPRAVLKSSTIFHCNQCAQLVTKPEEWRWSSAGWF